MPAAWLYQTSTRWVANPRLPRLLRRPRSLQEDSEEAAACGSHEALAVGAACLEPLVKELDEAIHAGDVDELRSAAQCAPGLNP